MKITLVTGLWDIKRGDLDGGWGRNFDHYLNKFQELLEVNVNIIIFGDESLEEFVWSRRNKSNTQFILRKLDWFKSQDFFDKIQKIRTDENWYNQTGWLKESTQCRLEMYNPIVMSKIFLLNDARILDSFNSDYMFWIDAGITNTVHKGYFTHDKVLDKITKYYNKFSFICFPYEATNEIHGFKYPNINKFTNKNVNKVARGGFFGGHKSTISEINTIYYNLLSDTLNQNYMGTEESLFTIMVYKYPNLINYFDINDDGLINTFFENIKNDTLIVKNDDKKINTNDVTKVSLYVIGFNSPNQFQTLIKSMLIYDDDFINKPKKYLLNNSTDLSTTPDYKKICEDYGFTHIKMDNLGICGGRQWIAEHFDASDSDYMFFFEDDMFFHPIKDDVCKNGFNRYVHSLYSKSLSIIHKNNFDFIKLNYTEFFGDNGTQWSWYNVPQEIREKYWPHYSKLPNRGLDPNSPKTEFKNIYTDFGMSYITGDIYYCNWPQIVSRTGNIKMFLNTKWIKPHEQTWMSHIFQLTKKGEINPALLLLTPTEHNRFEHYDSLLRKES